MSEFDLEAYREALKTARQEYADNEKRLAELEAEEERLAKESRTFARVAAALAQLLSEDPGDKVRAALERAPKGKRRARA